MKKKIYFIISSLIMIATSIKAMIYSDQLISSMIESFKDVQGDLGERIVNLFQNSGHIYIGVLTLITIVLNGMIVYWACNDKLVRNKEKVIAFLVICLFTAMYPINELFAIISIIVMASIKRQDKNDFPSKKEKLPVVKKEEVTNDKIIYAILLLAIYFSQFVWGKMISDSQLVSVIVSIFFYIGMIILSLLFFKDLLKDNFKVFKRKFRAYMQNIIPMVGKFYLVYLFVAMMAFSLAGSNISENQNNVEQLPILLLFPLAVIYAPIVEECLFRGCLRRFIKSDKLFVIISGIVFGLLHTISSEATLYNVLVMAIPYATLGGFLAYLYVKTNNMFCNMSFHAFQNLLAVIMTVLIKGI